VRYLRSIYDQLKDRAPTVPVTYLLLSINMLVFIAMLIGGAGLWHSPNGVQLKWGANFGPATQDGEWWRLFTAMFIHFGIVHLCLNCFSLWDVGQLVERMYGRWRFLSIYLISGLFGNLLSLVVQGNDAVSGGASGAIFGVYGAALVFLWRERKSITAYEFRWLFGGGAAFAIIMIVLGLMIPGIDNAAHVGGLLAGMISCVALSQSLEAKKINVEYTIVAILILSISSVMLIENLPKPKYKWGDEQLLQSAIQSFIAKDQQINRNWLTIQYESKQGDKSFAELASKIDFAVSQPYQESYAALSKLPNDPSLPSSQQLENLLSYTAQRKDQSEAIVDGLRKQQHLVEGSKH
jgi:rhomboid protease GluP